MQNEQQPTVFPESLTRKHEVSEKNVRNVLFVGGGAAFLLLFGFGACALTIHFLSHGRPMQSMAPMGILVAPNLQPLERFPKPTLQMDDDHSQMLTLYSTENARLNSYGWVDRSKGIVRIPIEQAMDLIVQRGLPTQTNDNSQTDGSPLQLIQRRAEQ